MGVGGENNEDNWVTIFEVVNAQGGSRKKYAEF